MDEGGFRRFIKEAERVPKGLTETTIRSHIKTVREFDAFLRSKSPRRQLADAKGRDVRSFISHLAKEDRSTFEGLIGLLRYSRFSENKEVELALLMALDGANVIGDLCGIVKNRHGKSMYEQVLGGFKPPAIGTPPRAMPKVTSDLMDRLESRFGEDETRSVLLTGPHAGPPEYYADERKMLLGSKNVDEYLRKRRKEFVDELEGHMKNGTLFYNQMIDQDVVDFVRGNPEVAGGMRRGNRIYCTKIPYMAIEYLKENDRKQKRYYGCHCPLARESILSGKTMSRNLCYCSAGYEKRPFDVAFGEPVKIEILKSILWGDTVCRFALEIPEKYRMKGK
jgi:hypothetical protein